MDELSIKRAEVFLGKGLAAVERGELKSARDHFKASAENFKTADAFTYWGWMEHHLGNTAFAIVLCHKAIEVDPDFGNPYNDIGSYLVEMGKPDEAIPWFEKAVHAFRYEPRHYPHMNLGRIYLSKNLPLKALEEFQKALDHEPDDADLAAMVETVRQTLH